MSDQNEIRTRSYLLWEKAGRPAGRDVEFWLRAEAQLATETICVCTLLVKQERFVMPRLRVSAPPRKLVATRVMPRKVPRAALAIAAS